MSENSMPKTLINICGSERSGSTMLDLILGNDPKAFSCGEVYALYHPWRKHHFNPTCGCGENCAYLQEFKKVRQDQFHQLLFEKYGYSWVVDSSKDLTWVIDNQKWVIQNQGRVLNLVIWKQPATFTVSFLKRGHGPDYWRSVFIGYYQKFLETKLPFVSLCYDDFVRAPEQHLENICKLTGMCNFKDKMNFWEKTHHQLFGSGGTAKQVSKRSSEIFKQDGHLSQFEEQVKSLQTKLDDDVEVMAIINAMRQRDIARINSSDPTLFNNDDFGKKPLWYYTHKNLLRFKRYFPGSIA